MKMKQLHNKRSKSLVYIETLGGRNNIWGNRQDDCTDGVACTTSYSRIFLSCAEGAYTTAVSSPKKNVNAILHIFRCSLV